MDYGNAAYFPYVLATKSPKTLFVNVTIDQALWGYESPIFAYIHSQNAYVSSYYTGLSAGNMSDPMTAINSTVYDTVRGQFDNSHPFSLNRLSIPSHTYISTEKL